MPPSPVGKRKGKVHRTYINTKTLDAVTKINGAQPSRMKGRGFEILARSKSMTYQIYAFHYCSRNMSSLGYGLARLAQYQHNVTEWEMKVMMSVV